MTVLSVLSTNSLRFFTYFRRFFLELIVLRRKLKPLFYAMPWRWWPESLFTLVRGYLKIQTTFVRKLETFNMGAVIIYATEKRKGDKNLWTTFIQPYLLRHCCSGGLMDDCPSKIEWHSLWTTIRYNKNLFVILELWNKHLWKYQDGPHQFSTFLSTRSKFSSGISTAPKNKFSWNRSVFQIEA
jgi:hypothetical protein